VTDKKDQSIKNEVLRRRTKNQALRLSSKLSLDLVLVNFRPCFVLGFATSGSRYLVGLGARQRMTWRRGRFAYAVEDRTCWLSLIVLTRRALPIHTCFGRECVICTSPMLSPRRLSVNDSVPFAVADRLGSRYGS
jgi:hypothetical protein